VLLGEAEQPVSSVPRVTTLQEEQINITQSAF